MPQTLISVPHCAVTHNCGTRLERLLRPCYSPRKQLWGSSRHLRKTHYDLGPHVTSAATQQDSLDSHRPTHPSTSTPDCPPSYRICCAQPEQAEQVARLNAEAFTWILSSNMKPGRFKQYTEQAEVYYQQSIYQDSVSQLKQALIDKRQAGRRSREATLRRQSNKLRADIARLQGQPVPVLPMEDKLQRVAAQGLQRKRQFVCLVAEERSSRAVVASCVLSLAAPDALLPAPFPTTKPWRLYCSNMAVATAHRRQGLATALLHRCQRIGGLWGYSDIWLHVDIVNKQAQDLYLGSGFGIKSQDGWYYILGRKRYLLQKALPDKSSQRTAQQTDLASAGGSVRGSDGVFVWDVQPDSDGTVVQSAVQPDADSQNS